MRRFLPLSIALLLPVCAASAAPVALSAPPGSLCRPAIAAAERAQAIPPNLLAAIGRIESGRKDQTTGAWNPWPWTINAEGQGSFFDTRSQAIEAVRALQARGIRSIDVGCMQVNLHHHPDAFAGLEQAFDPTTNAAYAARFLNQLYGQTRDWPRAVGMYHSATPERGEDYRRKVLAVWPEEQRNPAPSPLASGPGMMPNRGSVMRDAFPVAAAGAVGPTTPGRDLMSYRAMPVMTARIPPPVITPTKAPVGPTGAQGGFFNNLVRGRQIAP